MFELDGKEVKLEDLKVMLENGKLIESPWGTGLFFGRQQLIYMTHSGCYGVDGNQLRRKLGEAGLLADVPIPETPKRSG